ncbi:2-succinyl-5-enolpyruvyl-6-hydroxy-3-cyclohexene-1-carboxylic-acid synthase [Paramicrobacterium agarici]|uniref:2-succinyl-5-enolpyruvyl-6-hydroxy-3-cyclohexene-1-carboxylate synthase n=1 Tax=Paramicrobacterium agarici TaxID=630514 RepID=A0A2A9DU29_9MICO|nr:2-succinyl-5-enolpyruvyl-6-hydroxy-3-cyclohexene-1-carboxylic-acid synthase [Microbacterium agarici]PFG29399.1 2-succinyl-5-enolpyruvyl-6-hydroxy-3-cyclohexene-1-carboxylate synthase [Microbacterium agarici]
MPDEPSVSDEGRSEPNAAGDSILASNQAPATTYALALLNALAQHGLTDVVVCPGSRSQALALAAAALEQAEVLRVHVRIDERSAAFFALGLGVESGHAAAVVTTSGSAVAHLHPAVLEAHHSGVPLLLVTADRPEELRGIRSNQTTVQPGIFGGAVRFERDVAAPVGTPHEIERAAALAREAMRAANGRGVAGSGPVHLNVAFREPLSSSLSETDVAEELADATGADSRAVFGGVSTDDATQSGTRTPEAEAPRPSTSARFERPSVTLDRGPRTVVIAGHGAGPAAEELAHAGSWPLIAEVTSGARFGRNLVVPYRELLRDVRLGGRIERAVVFGHPTLSREVPALLQRPDVDVTVVAPTGIEAYNPARRARVVATASVAEGPADRDWLGAWVVASREHMAAADRDTAPSLDDGHSNDPAARARFARAEFAAVRAPIDRRMLAEELWRVTWPHDRLVLAASRLIRVADAFVAGKKIPVHANRGLAGIDGTIATAHGIASVQQKDGMPGVTRVLVGDLALLHDAGSLLGGHGEAWPRLQVIVGNDGGGTIFDDLEVAKSAERDVFDRVQYTPHGVDVAALAQAYGWDHVRAQTRADLDQALTTPRDAPVIIEVPLER